MSEHGHAAPSARRRDRWVFAAVLALLALVWGGQTTGIVSSNDGSHVALARALSIRGETRIDPEVMLTLYVDRAQRDGHEYSDRPPGTAFAAMPAARLAAPLDRRWEASSLARMRSKPPPENIEDTLVVRPASGAYLHTYGTRRRELGVRSVNLLALQGTAVLIGVHTIVLGLVGVCLLFGLLRTEVGRSGRYVAALCLGLATLWGPYATALFSHVTAGVALAGLVYGLERLRESADSRDVGMWGVVAGIGGSWAVSADYALAAAVIPLVVLGAPWRRWPAVLAGVLPITLATLTYHDAAFGSPLSIGYDHQTNFGFARDRGATFSGSPIEGLWTLWGLGRGAGILAQSPIVLLGVVGLALGPRRRWLYGLLPWMALLVFHRTPWGGATSDHRYLVPALPLLCVGVGTVWQRFARDGSPRGRLIGIAIIVLAAVSAALTWSNFLAWRG